MIDDWNNNKNSTVQQGLVGNTCTGMYDHIVKPLLYSDSAGGLHYKLRALSFPLFTFLSYL